MFRQLLMAGVSRAVFSPENDEGFEPDADAQDQFENDADFEDEDDGDADGGAEDRFEEDDAGDDEGDEGEADQVGRRPASRGENRIAAATRTAAEAKAEAAELRAQIDRITAGQTQQQQHLTQQQEQERLALMDPGERAEYIARQTAAQTQQTLAQIQFNSWDANDKVAFDALASRNPAAAKVRDKVESYLQDMRKSGTNAPRETVLKYVLGEMALNRAPKARAAGARAAADGRQRQQVRTPATRGDVSAGGQRRGSEAAQRRARLENVEI